MTSQPHRKLGTGGLSVSTIGLGCMSLSGVYGAADDAASEALIHYSIDKGVDHLDSSDMYGWGHNESLLGRALKGRRDASASLPEITAREAGGCHRLAVTYPAARWSCAPACTGASDSCRARRPVSQHR